MVMVCAGTRLAPFRGFLQDRAIMAEQQGVRPAPALLWADRADVVDRVERGAVFYVCGDGRRMAPAVLDTCTRMYREAAGVDDEDAEVWIRSMQREHGRPLTDMFARGVRREEPS